MSRRAVLARRRDLIARSESHRQDIAWCLRAWDERFRRVNQIVEGARRIQRSAPAVLVLLATLWAAGRRPRRGSGDARDPAARISPRARTLWRALRAAVGLVSTA